MRHHPLSVTGVCLVLWTGCTLQTPPPTLPEARPLGRDLPVVQPADPDAAPSAPAAVTGDLTVDQATRLALLHSPRLAAFAWSVRAAEAEQLQAGLWPNPELDVEIENLAGSGPYRRTDAAETTIGVGQLIEVAGKRAKRTRVAALDARLAGWDYEAARLAVFAEVVSAFTDVLAAQEHAELATQRVTVAERVLDAVQNRVAAGKDAALAATRARVGLSRARIDQGRARQELQAARAALAATWGASKASFDRAVGALTVGPPVPDPNALGDSLDANPDVARWETEIEQRRAALALARAGARPDPTLAGSYRRFEEGGESAFVVGLSLPLPVTNRNQGAIAAARAALAEARQQQRAVRAIRRAELATALADLRAAREAAQALEAEVLPGAEAAFEAAQTGYRAGKFDYLVALDAQRSLFEVRAEFLDTLRDYQRAKARTEALIGAPLDAVEVPGHDG